MKIIYEVRKKIQEKGIVKTAEFSREHLARKFLTKIASAIKLFIQDKKEKISKNKAVSKRQ